MSENPSTAGTSWRHERDGDGVWTLWFDAPGRSHNVLDWAAFDALGGALDAVEADPSAKGVLVRSAKAKGFCAGADLRTFHECEDPGDLAAYLRHGSDAIGRLAGLKVPTTAVVHGACLGGGLEVALACRCRVALASAAPLQIGSPEVQLGLVPAWGATTRLPRLLAPRDGLNLLVGGHPIGFLQAKSQGLVQRLVTHDETGKIAETLRCEPVAERPLAGEHWDDELEFAAARAADQPADFPEAQQAILDLVRVDLREGPQAAREAAIARCVERAMEPATREAIADFFGRRGRGG